MVAAAQSSSMHLPNLLRADSCMIVRGLNDKMKCFQTTKTENNRRAQYA